MAIALDNSLAPGVVTNTSYTFSFTTSGSDRVLVVFIKGGAGSGDIITGVTYAGVSMTRINTQPGGDDRQQYSYILINPTTGANNVVISASASNIISPLVHSFNGADQTTQPDVNGAGSRAASTTYAPALTTVTGGAWLLGMADQNYVLQSYSAGGTTTKSVENYAPSFYDGPFATAGSNHLDYASTASGAWWGLLVGIRPLIASGPANLKSWNGLAKASIKSINGLAIASIKSINGLE